MDSSPAASESHQSQTKCGSAEVTTRSTERTAGLKKPLHETWERSVFCSGKPQDVAEFRTMTLTREVVYRYLRRPKRKMYLTGSKAGGPEPSKSYETKIPDICHELQGLVSAMRGFGLALMQYFLTLPCCFSPTFGMGLCILCHWILQVCYLLFGIRVVTVNRLPWISQDFGLLNDVEIVKDLWGLLKWD